MTMPAVDRLSPQNERPADRANGRAAADDPPPGAHAVNITLIGDCGRGAIRPKPYGWAAAAFLGVIPDQVHPLIRQPPASCCRAKVIWAGSRMATPCSL